MTLRVAFCGNDPWSVPSLDAIAGDPGLEVVLVVTNPPRPAGRGLELRPTAVADAARRLDVPLVEVDRLRDGPGPDALAAARPDVVVVVAYGEILGREILELGPHGAINLHFSLLPRWRGAAPVTHALLAGDDRTGVTVMRMDQGLDTGPVLSQLEDEIRPDDDAGTLGMRLATLGARLLVGVLNTLPDGGPPERAQDPAGVTLAPRLGPEARAIDWTAPAADIVRRVRALSPSPGATTAFRGRPLKLLSAGTTHEGLGRRDADLALPGSILAADERGVLVGAGEGGVRLAEVAPEGRKRMPAADWARGARFAPGERLG
jgi:methionyl-tRNA formyltransferase